MTFGKIWAGSRRLSLGQQIKTLQKHKESKYTLAEGLLQKHKESKYTLAEGLWQIHRTNTLMVYEKAVCRYETLVSTKRILMVCCKYLGDTHSLWQTLGEL